MCSSSIGVYSRIVPLIPLPVPRDPAGADSLRRCAIRPERAHPPIVDLPVAVAVGLASWTAARLSQLPNHVDRGPWRPGPGPRPGFELPAPVSWGVVPCLVVLVIGLALRRVWPRVTFLVVVAAVTGYLALGAPYGPVLIAPALSVHALALTLPLNRWAPMTMLLVPMLMAGYWDQPYLGLLDPTLYVILVFGFSIMVVPALIGLLRRNRRESARLEHDQELRRYAYEERLRIARDVHDVVGHSLSVINLQAGVALHVLAKRPDQVETSLEAIKRTSREALAELRTTLAVFRDPAAGDPLTPGAGLDRLDDLVAALRAASRNVTVTVQGVDQRSLPAAVDQAAYRIIQEALTNVVRHSGNAAATVSISRLPDQVVLQITDDAPQPVGPIVEGNGILGMRERARAVGGTLSVSPRSSGGFCVRAELPVSRRAEPE
jgi:signal transduction histidine kinase